MNEVLLEIDETKHGKFIIEDDGQEVGTMKVHLEDNDLIVEGTEVDRKMRGQHLGKRLIEAMVHHARHNHYNVVTLCPFVQGQFEKHPEDYRDVWKRSA
ncbi:MAG: GNAT family N-acetyltransferase [Bacteroidia bacterium]